MYRIAKISDLNGLRALEYSWNKLYSSNPDLSFGHSFQWNYDFLLYGFHKLNNKNTEFLVYFLYDDTELVAIAPMQKNGRTISRLSDGDTHADYQGWVVASDISNEAIDHLLNQILCDYKTCVVSFNRVRIDHPMARRFLTKPTKFFKRVSQESYAISLPKESREYFESLKKSERKKQQRSVRSLVSAGYRVEFVAYRGTEIPLSDLNAIKDIYRHRVIDITGEFRYDSRYIDWFFAWVNSSDEFLVGCLFLIDDAGCKKLVAFEAGNIHNHRIECFMGQFDLHYKSYSIGLMCLYNLIMYCIENQTKLEIHEYDLTVGSEPYKVAYGAKPTEIWEFKFNYFLQNRILRYLYQSGYAFLRKVKHAIKNRKNN